MGGESDGLLMEGVLDLAFEDEDGWTIVDSATGHIAEDAPDQSSCLRWTDH